MPEKISAISLQYFPLEKVECFACHSPTPTAVRVAVTLDGLMVTLLCETCSGKETQSLLDEGQMILNADETALISTHYAELEKEAMIKASNAAKPKSFLQRLLRRGK